jgi:hypothetical protein
MSDYHHDGSKYDNMPVEEFATQGEFIWRYQALISVPDNDNVDPNPCYASKSFYNLERYDTIQVSYEENKKIFCRLMAAFSYCDFQSNTHSLAFIQHTNLESRSDGLFGLPIVSLQHEYEVIPASAVDDMVEFKSRNKHPEHFYVCKIEFY